ncbi:MAG: ABC transporter permease, partial [Ruminococcus sp.]|nr:ABC transporter permease [Ruminococcus sp.]
MSEIGNLVISWIMCGITFGSIIMYGALGEILTEKSGNMNLGTPGIMCIGGAFGFGGAYLYEINTETPNAVVTIIFALVCAFLSSALAGALFCFLTTTLRANQNVTGLALTIFGSGLAKFFGTFIIPKGTTTVKAAFANRIFSAAIATESPVLKIFLGHGFMMYLALVVAIAMGYFLKRTRMGLNLRAVGENPATADAAGINVSRFKYAATILGAGISGLGGVYYVLDYNYGGWS